MTITQRKYYFLLKDFVKWFGKKHTKILDNIFKLTVEVTTLDVEILLGLQLKNLTT